MARYETYTDGGATHFVINVVYKENGEVEYKLVDRCCDMANDFVENVEKLKAVVKLIEVALGCDTWDFSSEYLENVWQAQCNHSGFTWECPCETTYTANRDFVFEELDLKSLVDIWKSMYSLEQIFLNSCAF